MTSPDRLFHLHVQSTPEDAEVFRFNQHHLDDALARNPDLRGRIEVSLDFSANRVEDWTAAHHARFDARLRTAEMVVGYHFPVAALTRASLLRAVHVIGSGIEHLHPLDWLRDDLVLTNNKGVHAPKAAEYAGLALLMLNAAIPALVTQQRQARYRQIFTPVIAGKTVLIVGVGEMGAAAATRAKQMGLTVLGINRSQRAHPACNEMHGPDALHDLLSRADFVILNVPVTAETRGFFGPAEFERMKPGAGFVNMARAETVDYDALMESLTDGGLGGAVLDVFDPEPLPSDSPLWQTPNLIITPHVGSDDLVNYLPRTLDLVFDNVRRLMKGDAPRNVVDPERAY